eukprot:SAG31_NODE_19887_length_589_cov_0.934694_1_plen_38_part_10
MYYRTIKYPDSIYNHYGHAFDWCADRAVWLLNSLAAKA